MLAGIFYFLLSALGMGFAFGTGTFPQTVIYGVFSLFMGVCCLESFSKWSAGRKMRLYEQDLWFYGTKLRLPNKYRPKELIGQNPDEGREGVTVDYLPAQRFVPSEWEEEYRGWTEVLNASYYQAQMENINKKKKK